jgi:hypothetical protein
MQLSATSPWQGSAQYVAITAGQTYNFTAWERSTTAGGMLSLVSFDSNWNRVGSQVDFVFSATGSWTALTGTYVAPAVAVRVGVVAQSSGSGTFWFDDIGLSH